MFIRKLALVAAAAVLGSLAVGKTGSSSALSYLHDNVTSGSLLPADTTIMPRRATGDLATFTLPGFGTFSCADNTFDATVGASGGATITGTLHSLTLMECADTIPLLSLSSCHLVNGPRSLTITATSHNGGTLGVNDIILKCNTGGGSGCYYTAAAATGIVTNAGATLNYNNVGIVHTTGSGDLGSICGNSATLSMTFTDVTSGGTGRTVVLNQTA